MTIDIIISKAALWDTHHFFICSIESTFLKTSERYQLRSRRAMNSAAAWRTDEGPVQLQ
jgi:hypothetical protein